MSCTAMTPERLAAWVDGTLDAPLARDVACHVATCPACHAAAARLREETDALRQALGGDKAPAHLWARISTQLAAEPVPPARWVALRARLARPRVAAAVAAVLLVGVLLVQHVPGARVASDTTLRTLAVETAQDYVTFRISQRGLDVASDDPSETLLWLQARINGALPDMAEHVLDYRLIGGRLCWLMGQRLAALTYAKGDAEITVYVMDAPTGSAASRHRPEDGRARHAEGPVRSVVRVEAGLLIAVVSDLPDIEKDRFATALGQAMRPPLPEI